MFIIMIVAELQMIDHPKGNTSVQYGEDVTLTVSAVGPQPLAYRWTKDGQKIPNSNNDKLTIISFSSDDQGCYSCIVIGGQQSIESKPASLGLGMNLLT